MTLEARSLLYAPIYGVFGVPAGLTLGDGSAFTITAVDLTRGLQVPLMPAVDVTTVGPEAVILAGDLDDLGLTDSDLDGATLALNGRNWLIQSHEPLPSWNGEPDGEYRLFLERAG